MADKKLTARQKALSNPVELTACITAGLLSLGHFSFRLKLLRKIKNKKINTWQKHYTIMKKEYDNYLISLMRDFYGWKAIEKDRNEYGNRDLDIMFYNNWRREIIKRDSYKCSICDSKKKLEFHHIKRWIDYPEERYNPENGVILCHKCHVKQGGHGHYKIVGK